MDTIGCNYLPTLAEVRETAKDAREMKKNTPLQQISFFHFIYFSHRILLSNRHLFLFEKSCSGCFIIFVVNVDAFFCGRPHKKNATATNQFLWSFANRNYHYHQTLSYFLWTPPAPAIATTLWQPILAPRIHRAYQLTNQNLIWNLPAVMSNTLPQTWAKSDSKVKLAPTLTFAEVAGPAQTTKYAFPSDCGLSNKYKSDAAKVCAHMVSLPV